MRESYFRRNCVSGEFEGEWHPEPGRGADGASCPAVRDVALNDSAAGA